MGAGAELERQPVAAVDGHEREVRGAGPPDPGTHEGLVAMMARLAGFVALVLVAGATTVPVSTRQPAAAPAAPAIDPKEMAVVEKIRTRILEQAKKAGTAAAKPYTVTVPEHHGHVRHGPDPCRHVRDGLGRSQGPRRPEAHPAGDARRVLDDDHRGQLGRVPDVHVRRPGQRTEEPGRHRRRSEPAVGAAPRDEFRSRQRRVSGDQHDAARRQQVRAVAERAHWRVLPRAHRGRVGVRLPRRRSGVAAGGATGRGGLVPEELADHRVHRWHLPQAGHEEAQRVGPARHAGQRHGVDGGPARAVPGRARDQPMGEADDVLPDRRARRFVERPGRAGELHDSLQVRPRLEGARPAAPHQPVVHDRRRVAWLPARTPGEDPERRGDVQGVEQRGRSGPVLTNAERRTPNAEWGASLRRPWCFSSAIPSGGVGHAALPDPCR